MVSTWWPERRTTSARIELAWLSAACAFLSLPICLPSTYGRRLSMQLVCPPGALGWPRRRDLLEQSCCGTRSPRKGYFAEK